MTDVIIVAHHERRESAGLTREAAAWLASHGHTAYLPEAEAEALGVPELGRDCSLENTGLALSIGGDGTVLRLVDLLGGASIPVLAVNLGGLAYLSEVEPAEMIPALGSYLAGECTIEHRMVLRSELVRAGSYEVEGSWRALNEAVLEKADSGHTVRLGVRIDGAPFISYASDGMIIATPTGSTAYSLSARGPVVSPRHRAVLVTPVSPHQLFDRSLVLTPDETVEVEVTGRHDVVLTVDGQVRASLRTGDRVRCQPAEEDALFVRFGKHRFHQVLRAKFGLADR